jgi:hypothetical protein
VDLFSRNFIKNLNFHNTKPLTKILTHISKPVLHLVRVTLGELVHTHDN